MIEFQEIAYYHQRLESLVPRSCCYETVSENPRKMPLVEVLFSIIALLQLATLL